MAKSLTYVQGRELAEAGLDPVSREILERQTGTSIFDPVLAEIAYRWFCPPEGKVIDPFAGGSVRGIVASRLGRNYLGIELRAEQIAANREQAKAICHGNLPEWIEGDSRIILKTLQPESFDFVFSCPPYGDLEIYSEDPRDLSRMGFDAFIEAFREIVAESIRILRPNRFACFVVGDFRDHGRGGAYRAFPWLTVDAFLRAGAQLYNEAVLVTPVGSTGLRIAGQFQKNRKLGKTHQNVFIFVKGDPRKAIDAIGEVEVGQPEPEAS